VFFWFSRSPEWPHAVVQLVARPHSKTHLKSIPQVEHVPLNRGARSVRRRSMTGAWARALPERGRSQRGARAVRNSEHPPAHRRLRRRAQAEHGPSTAPSSLARPEERRMVSGGRRTRAGHEHANPASWVILVAVGAAQPNAADV